MKAKNLLFLDDDNKNWMNIIILFASLNFLFVAIIFIITGAIGGGIVSLVWWIITSLLFSFIRNKDTFQQKAKILYLINVCWLSLLEEGMIYAVGGGLQGKATSLYDDYIHSIPIFMAIGIVLYFMILKYELNSGETFITAFFIGYIVEGIFGGAGLLIGSAGAYFYGTMMTALIPENLKEEKRASIKSILLIIIGTIFSFIAVLAGAIIADNIYKAFPG